jgi:hypothetical protein
MTVNDNPNGVKGRPRGRPFDRLLTWLDLVLDRHSIVTPGAVFGVVIVYRPVNVPPVCVPADGQPNPTPLLTAVTVGLLRVAVEKLGAVAFVQPMLPAPVLLPLPIVCGPLTVTLQPIDGTLIVIVQPLGIVNVSADAVPARLLACSVSGAAPLGSQAGGTVTVAPTKPNAVQLPAGVVAAP